MNDGIVRWAGGAFSGWYIPLDGIIFPTYGGPSTNLRVPQPWANFERGYADAQYTVQNGVCTLTGMISFEDKNVGRWPTQSSTNLILVTLPEDCRPTEKIVVNANFDASTDRVEIDAAGVVTWKGGSVRTVPWISLNGITFTTTKGTELGLTAGQFAPAGGEWRVPQFTVDSNICYLSGVVQRSPGATDVITQLDPKCRPKGQVVFSVNNGNALIPNAQARVDVMPDGKVVIVGDAANDLFSLDSIHFISGENQVVAVRGV